MIIKMVQEIKFGGGDVFYLDCEGIKHSFMIYCANAHM